MASRSPSPRDGPNEGPQDLTRRKVLLGQSDAGRALRWLAGRSIDSRSLAVALALMVIAFVVYSFVNHDRRASLDYFVPLANAFLHGQLGFETAPPSGGYNELVPFGGQLYVVYPPMPAVVLMPFVLLFGTGMDQARVSILFGALNVALAMWVALGVGARRSSAVVLAIVFGFGSITWYSAQAGTSWQIAHVLALTFALAAIGSAVRDGHPWLIGLLVAAMGLCRLPMLLGAPFFLAYIFHRAARSQAGSSGFGTAHDGALSAIRSVSLRRLAVVGAPFALCLTAPLVLYLLYNAARFGSPFETGYALIPGLLQEFQYKDGFFSVVNIPRKLYAMFLSAPVEVQGFPWIQSRELGGLSIVLTTPVFLWAVRTRGRDLFTLSAWLSVALVMIPVLLHADPGGVQFGFRYAQDVYPFAFVLVARALATGISFEAWLAIGVGLLVNAWGMGSAYFAWWYRS
jgi:hypothetical protein